MSRPGLTLSHHPGPRLRRALIVGTLAVWGSGTAAPVSETPPVSQKRPVSETPPSRHEDSREGPSFPQVFSEKSHEVGVDFVHFNGMSGEYFMAEINGAGCGLLDYDNDGDLDLYLIQGQILGEGKTLAEARFPPPGDGPVTDRLYRNDLAQGADGSRTLRFTDVTHEAGLDNPGYGFGVATGDFNNDGWVDLYLTNFGSNRLWQNNGRGADGTVTFKDVTAATGTDDDRWSVPAAFLDYDRDGWLDLYVGNYVHFTYKNHKVCRTAAGAQDYCGPNAYAGVSDRLLRNRRDGSFDDVSIKSRIQSEPSKSLGVVTADLNQDGWIDIYVANDGVSNQMWINQGDGTFSDEALLAGSAVNMEGHPEASMGVDAADFDGDGDEDLFMTHLVAETNTLYRNDGTGMFEDATIDTGLGVPSWRHTSWGTRWFDYDNDGWLDLLVANGAVRTVEELARRKDPYPFHEPNQLFRNQGNGKLAETTQEGGPAFERSEVTRGAAFGDLDNDGDTDVVLLNNNGPARLLLNQVGSEAHWLGLRLTTGPTPQTGRDALGARLGVFRPGRPTLWRRVRTDGSFASANDPRALVGLGESPQVEKVQVFWPSGLVEEFYNLPVDRYSRLHEGSGERIESPASKAP